jgi:bifunctional NMN adenylyltransferase/nudix hydrolase
MTIGVVIGRFQVAELHAGHRYLIEQAMLRHNQVLILVGTRDAFPTARNPLPFALRREMILSEFPSVAIAEIADHPSDRMWSLNVDQLIASLYPNTVATLYGSRDSFIPYYVGVHQTVILPQIPAVSGTDLRENLGADLVHTPDFRRGVIHTVMNRAPVPYPAVDAAIIRPSDQNILLGQKRTDGAQFRFIGGFFDPTTDTSLEHAVRREVYEETGGMEADGYRYIGSHKVDDWRYRGSTDCILTSLFCATYIFGVARATDDISRLGWFPLSALPEILIPAHVPLCTMLLKNLTQAAGDVS